ncbi:type II toxin-antitoxin system HicA family toxin [Parvibaculaceae bacterium PLY_AMNH_Bact1]|nr:type II toxin-antitoxin system HicA family toxin [Parvibaculaceae bacterium PLY_AMNH_Bact1]
MKYRRFIKIIEDNGFECTTPAKATSHRKYTARRDGRLYVITVSYHLLSDEITPGTQSSMIRQSGLPKKLFRK